MQALSDGKHLYLRLVAATPSPAPAKDSLTVRLGDENAWTIGADGKADGKLPVTILTNRRSGNVWEVVLETPAPATKAQFERQVETVGKDGKPLIRDYAWSPQMAPPWPVEVRWGRLTLQGD